MPLRTLRRRAALLSQRPEVAYTLTQVKAEPLAAAYVSVFEELLSDWEVVHRTSLSLIDAIAEAQARIDVIDARVDNLVSRIFKAAMTLANDKRDDALVVRYFGKEDTVKQIQRPVLGTELARVRGWIKSLKESEHGSLAALGLELEALVAEADLAVKAKSDAEDKKKDFNEIGDRKKFVDKLNAARKVTYGELAKMAHQTMGLPSNFADLFFRRETREEDDEGEPLTVEQAKANVAAAEAELEARKKALLELEAEEAKAAEAAQKLAAEKALLAELEKSAEEAQKKLAIQRAKLRL